MEEEIRIVDKINFRKATAILKPSTMDIFEANAHETNTVAKYWQGIIDQPINFYLDHLRDWYYHNQKIAKEKMAQYLEGQKGNIIAGVTDIF